MDLANEPLAIYNDNVGAIALSKNPVSHEKSKHIAMRHHYVREKVKDNTVSLNHISSAENLADMLTKILPVDTLEKLSGLLGMKQRLDQGGVSALKQK